MNAWRDRVAAAALGIFGAMWVFAAVMKIAKPIGAVELVSQVVPPAIPAKPAVALAVAVETALGAAMILRAIRGLVPSLVLLCALSGLLFYAQTKVEGSLVPCGCFGNLFGASITEALVRNAVLVALHVGLILWGRAKPAT